MENRFSGQPGRNDEVELARQLIVDHVRIDRMKYSGYEWHDVDVSLTDSENGMTLALNSEKLSGSLTIPVASDEPYRLNMERLHIPEAGNEADSDENPDVLADVNPALLPNIDATIQSLVIGDQDMGAVSLSIEQTSDGLKVDNIKTSLAGLTLTGFADWVYSDNEHHSCSRASLKVAGLGDLNKALGLPELIVSIKSFGYQPELEWIAFS